MKKFTIILMALLFATVGNYPVLAKKRQKTELQQQKAEIKAWKKRKSAMKPLQLKDLVEENHRLKDQNQKLVEEAKFVREALEAELITLRMRLEGQKDEQRRQIKESLDNLPQLDGLCQDDWATDKHGKFYIKGLIFKVQIGAYKKRDLRKILEGKKTQGVFEQEQLKGINMYTLGHFRDYWKANQFKKELRAMGLKDAWVVPFKEGKRVPLKEVLQKVVKKK